MSYYTKEGEDVEVLAGEENQIWKALLGLSFAQQLAGIYEEHKRDYNDLLNGVPAHAEDVFYRIQKSYKLPGELEYKVIKNTIIISIYMI